MKGSLPFLIITVCIGMYFLYISPTVAEVKALSLRKAEYTDVLNRTQDLARKRDEILAQYNNIPAEDLEKLNKMIPGEFNAEMFANDVNNIASKYGIVVQGVKISEPEQRDRGAALDAGSTEAYKTYTAQISLKGQYNQFIKFLGSLESSLRLLDVSSLSVKYAKDERSSVDSSEFTLEIKVYSLR